MRRLMLVGAALPVLLAACAGLPEGLNFYVSQDGCLPSGECPYGAPSAFGRNYYWSPTRTVVLASGAAGVTVAHETCHAHQHQMILEDLGREPSNVNLEEWYETGEGRDWLAQGFEFDQVWHRTTNPNALEDNANTCAYFFLKPDELRQISPERFAWAEEWLR